MFEGVMSTPLYQRDLTGHSFSHLVRKQYFPKN